MTLITERIESVARRIYTEMLARPRIPEDICADIYLRFIVRMKRYRDLHPDVRKVGDAFVDRSVRWITKTLIAKKRKEEQRQRIFARICEELLAECPREAREQFGKETLARIFSFIEKISGKKRCEKYTIVFLLYYSTFLPDSFIAGAAKLIGADRRTTLDRADEVRKLVSLRVSESMQKRMNAAASCYYRLIMLQSGKTEHNAAAVRETIAKLKRLQNASLERLRAIEPVPRLSEIAAITGLHEDRVRYALAAFEKGLRGYL